jgi:hypothetical protein
MNKLLVTGVFKPYGETDEYGEALCTMELLYNQVTREQGIHSPRSNNLSYGLYMLAENIDVPTTVLDFPSWEDFTREVDSGQYSHIGISFIVPNVLKARRMAEYIRQKSPGTKILLGGHGTAIADLEELVEHDEICRGEGVSWLRSYLDEETNRPIRHPILPTSVNAFIYGAPILGKAGILIPGVGCQNSCRFCATSHKFDHKYTSFLAEGRDIFEVCQESERKMGVTDFGVLDENFCKEPVRARQLLDEMTRQGKAYTFGIFSSADAVARLGVDFLVRLGVDFIWIGVESKVALFEKTRGVDLHGLIGELQEHGITVLASAILFLEHHDKATIVEDIEWAIGLKSDLLQFMQFSPMPGTRLHADYDAQGKIQHDYPWARRHGQDTIWFDHPHFTAQESSDYLREAFQKKFQADGPGVLNMARTAIRGYLTVKREVAERAAAGLGWDPSTLRYVPQEDPVPDDYMVLRLAALRMAALKFRPALTTMLKYAPNERAAIKTRETIELYDRAFGKPGLTDRARSLFVRGAAHLENRRFQKHGRVMRQPKLIRLEYPDRSQLNPAERYARAQFKAPAA